MGGPAATALAAAVALALIAGCQRPAAGRARADAGAPGVGPAAIRITTDFASRLSQAYRARDAAAAAALFADDAVSVRIGQIGGEVRGRAAIEAELRRTFSRHRDAALTVGRIWVGPQASVIEYVFSGTRAPGKLGPPLDRPIGLVGALVVTFDREGRVSVQRVYLDESTVLGQIDLGLLPAGMKVRPVTPAVPAGTAVLATRGTRAEARNLEVSNRIWTALTAHRADDALAPMADDYLYQDFAAPTSLDRAGTLALVTRFLAALPDFAITVRPVEIAAGDDVVTEIVEQATFEGNPITLHGLDVRRYRAGRVVREWQYSNYAEVLRQISGTALPRSDEM